jgi:hypothetical protein
MDLPTKVMNQERKVLIVTREKGFGLDSIFYLAYFHCSAYNKLSGC